MAIGLVGPVGAAPRRLRPLYRVIDPYRAERLMERVKAAMRR